MKRVSEGEILATFEGRLSERDKVVALLEMLWEKIIPSIPKPPRNQFEKWAHIHAYQTASLETAFRAAARRLEKGRRFNDAAHPLQFISGVANQHRTNAKQAADMKKAA
jgi:hypothetical protein